jgi:hypothetical protein
MSPRFNDCPLRDHGQRTRRLPVLKGGRTRPIISISDAKVDYFGAGRVAIDNLERFITDNHLT